MIEYSPVTLINANLENYAEQLKYLQVPRGVLTFSRCRLLESLLMANGRAFGVCTKIFQTRPEFNQTTTACFIKLLTVN